MEQTMGLPKKAAMKYRICFTLLGLVMVCVWTSYMAGCGKHEPILIGFSGQLSGAFADLGIKGRDGALLAVENINEAGGIAGRRLKLLIRDDKGVPAGAMDADQQLVEAGVVAIIGHMTSGQTMAVINLIKKADVVMISPTTSTEILSGIDDHFFRVAGSTSTEGRLLARHVSQNKGRIKISAIFDTDNAAYTHSCWETFSAEFKKRGGKVVGKWGFSSSQRPDFNRILSEFSRAAPDAVFIIASSFDTAVIVQRIREIEPDTILYSSAWGLTDELLQNGGRAVEHVEGVVFFNPHSQNSAFHEFQTQYSVKFGRIPTFADSAGYEAVTLLAKALKETKGQAKGLLKALNGIKKFEGLMGTITMDAFGDAIRTYYIQRAENGEFVTVSSIEP